VWQDGARVELVTVAHLLYHFSRVWDGPLKLWKLKTKSCQAKRRALWELLFVPHMISCDMCWFLYHLVPIATSNMFQQKYVEVLALFWHSCSALAVNRFHWDQGCVYCVQFSMEPCFTKPNFFLPGRSSAHLCDCGGCGRFRVISVSNYLLILWKRTKRMGRFLMMFDYFVNGFIMFNQG
jgi:hypothetical protein